MADRGRGGYQQPRNPAAVSNPRSGARTDGGAGSKSQPLRVPTGREYGAAKAITEQQQGAPLADNGGIGQPGAPTPAGPAGGIGGSMMGGGGGAFGPTQRPHEPNDASPNLPLTNPAAANPQAALRVLYANFPHPAIRRLLDWSATGNRGV